MPVHSFWKFCPSVCPFVLRGIVTWTSRVRGWMATIRAAHLRPRTHRNLRRNPRAPEPVAASSSARSTQMRRSVGTLRGGGEAMVVIFDDGVGGYHELRPPTCDRWLKLECLLVSCDSLLVAPNCCTPTSTTSIHQCHSATPLPWPSGDPRARWHSPASRAVYVGKGFGHALSVADFGMLQQFLLQGLLQLLLHDSIHCVTSIEI